MTIPRASLALLTGVLCLTGAEGAGAAPIGPADICGSLHKADIQTLIAPPRAVVTYRWHKTKQAGDRLTVRLIIVHPRSREVYDGFQCQISGTLMKALPSRPVLTGP